MVLRSRARALSSSCSGLERNAIRNAYTLAFIESGKTETVAADGTEQSGIFESTVSLTIEQPGTWEIVRQDGQEFSFSDLASSARQDALTC